MSENVINHYIDDPLTTTPAIHFYNGGFEKQPTQIPCPQPTI